ITMGYDQLGRKTSMNDPDKGAWIYSYNSLGELISQIDAKSQFTSNLYDIRGRLYYRDQPNVKSVWEYDIGANWGLLVNEYSVGHYVIDNVAQIKNYIYDLDFHRPIETDITIFDGESPQAHNYSTSQTYDQYGRVFQSFDATGNGVLYEYSPTGYQDVIRDAADGQFGQIYYEVLNTNARGQITHEKYYNQFESAKYYHANTGFLDNIITTNVFGDQVQNLSFAFDRIGNLIRRTDYTPDNAITADSYAEIFEYDNRNRLLWETQFLNQIADPSKGYLYDATGNLITNGQDGYSYSQVNAGPHAVTSAKGNNYFYDANGNVTSRTGSEPATFAYTSFDKAHTITANGWISEIAYGANRSRYIRKDTKASTKVTHYLGSVEYIYENGTIKAKRYIGNLVINIDENTINRNQWGFNYLLKDHIGSTHAVVNKQGNIINNMSFNAWGARRQPAISSSSDVYKDYDIFQLWGQLGAGIEDTTNRGFTGHEHFDQVGIIHMNGRIYDPTIGRFLQADPIIQDPYNTQSLNRYSYVMNNPLSYTDPTGYSRLRKGWWQMPLAIAITVYTAGAASAVLAGSAATSAAVAGSVSQALAISVAGGALSGGVATGSLKGAVKGGIFAAITFGIGHGGSNAKGVKDGSSAFGLGNNGRIVAHSIVSGISAEIDGGSFGHGFASAILSQKLGTGRIFDSEQVGSFAIVSNAIIQGTISEATGGKFANGAMSAAFRVAFNDTFNRYPSKYPQNQFKTLEEGIEHAHSSNQYFSKQIRNPQWDGGGSMTDATGTYVYYNESKEYYEISNVMGVARDGKVWPLPNAVLGDNKFSKDPPHIRPWFGDDKTIAALVVTQASTNVIDRYGSKYQQYANKIGTVVVSTENGYHHASYRFGVTTETFKAQSATNKFE
ncbi:MAG: hypothetical protein JKY19_11685, partial [Alcanivoracaceae bacterium]|nr:hypothetical protein [Alcanivoracaceae bacterium]